MSITASSNPFSCYPVIIGNNLAIIQLGTINRIENDFIFSVGFKWKINNQTYQNQLETTLTINEASDGNKRIDVAILTVNNTIELLSGTESEGIAIRPIIPENAILLTEWNIDGAIVNDNSAPITGLDFIKKSFSKHFIFSETGTNLSIPLNPNGYSEIRLNNNDTTSISGVDLSLINGNASAELPYEGKFYLLRNISSVDKIILHNSNAADIPFYTENQEDLILPAGKSLLFSYYNGACEILFTNFTSSSTIPTLDEILEAGGYSERSATVGNFKANEIQVGELPEIGVAGGLFKVAYDGNGKPHFEFISNSGNEIGQIYVSFYPEDGIILEHYSQEGVVNGLYVTVNGIFGALNNEYRAILLSGLAQIADILGLEDALDNKADLVGGLVPSSQLPPTVDEILEYDTFADFPTIGESNKYYLALDTNKTYRWSGTTYVAINEGIALGETSSTAYRGDRGKIAYEHSQTIGNPHNTTATDVDALKRDGSNANKNIDILEYQIKAGQFELAQTPTQAFNVGCMRWNDADGTAELLLKGGNVTLQLGQEQLVRVVNKVGANLLESNYQAVKITGAQGQRLKIGLAQANSDLNSSETIGLVTENINNNQEGFVTTSGLVRGINTTGSLQGETWNDGDILYLSPTTAGRITNIKPTAPSHLVIIGYVVYAHANNGQIFVKVDNGYELEELHNVTDTNYTTPIDTDSLLTYDVTTSLWKRLSWSNIKASLKAYFDEKYTPKGLNIKITTPSSYVTGTLTETEVLKIEIPANTLSASDAIKIPLALFKKLNTNGNWTIRYKMSTSATMPSGSTDQIAISPAATAANLTIGMIKTYFIDSGNIKGTNFTNAAYTDNNASAGAISEKPFDRTVTNYFYVSIQLGSTSDQARLEALQINNL